MIKYGLRLFTITYVGSVKSFYKQDRLVNNSGKKIYTRTYGLTNGLTYRKMTYIAFHI